MKSVVAVLMAVTGILSYSEPARAASLTIYGESGSNTASATFSVINNSTLQVTLTNTSVNTALSYADVLTGFFFSVSNSPTLAPASVQLASGSSILNCPSCSGATDVSGQFLYGSGITGLGSGEAANVVAVTDFGFLSSAIGGNRLANPTGSGIDFGLVTGNTSFGQSLLTGSPLITTSVVISYSLNGGFDLNSVRGGFLWGTSLVPVNSVFDYGMTGATPEPGTSLLIGMGLAGTLLLRRRRRAK